MRFVFSPAASLSPWPSICTCRAPVYPNTRPLRVWGAVGLSTQPEAHCFSIIPAMVRLWHDTLFVVLTPPLRSSSTTKSTPGKIQLPPIISYLDLVFPVNRASKDIAHPPANTPTAPFSRSKRRGDPSPNVNTVENFAKQNRYM